MDYAKLCFSSGELASRIMRGKKRREDQESRDVVFEVPVDAKELRREVQRAEVCERLVVQRTQEALRREGF